MERTILLQGADAPGQTVPSHCNFGGEGTPYNVHLLPTIGVIAAPQSLYDPPFRLEGIDFNVMHDELLGYTADQPARDDEPGGTGRRDTARAPTAGGRRRALPARELRSATGRVIDGAPRAADRQG